MKRLICGDSRVILATLEADSIHAVVTDPPYHLTSIVKRFGKDGASPAQHGTDGAFARASKGFMGKEWDGGDIAFDPSFWREVYRVLRPGAHLLAFGGTRTYHRMAVAIEDAGFEIRDTIIYGYASGMPKSHNVSNNIDKLLTGKGPRGKAIAVASKTHPTTGAPLASGGNLPRYEPISDEAKTWDGWGTGIKPSWEPIVCARKPLSESSVARNVLKHGTGAINIDACRIATSDKLSGGDATAGNFTGSEGWDRPWKHDDKAKAAKRARAVESVKKSEAVGRWPGNTILSCQCDTPHEPGCPVADLDAQSGVLSSGFMAAGTEREGIGYGGGLGCSVSNDTYGDSGGASRFYFCAKPSRRERGEHNIHPTVKPVELMKYLCRLVCPPGGTVLDPFMGSGTTGIGASLGGFDFVGIEREVDYFRIAEMRNGFWREYEADSDAEAKHQPSLFTEDAA